MSLSKKEVLRRAMMCRPSYKSRARFLRWWRARRILKLATKKAKMALHFDGEIVDMMPAIDEKNYPFFRLLQEFQKQKVQKKKGRSK